MFESHTNCEFFHVGVSLRVSINILISKFKYVFPLSNFPATISKFFICNFANFKIQNVNFPFKFTQQKFRELLANYETNYYNNAKEIKQQ